LAGAVDPELLFERLLGQLEGFGELALINQNSIRTATVQCMEQTELAII